MSRERGVQPVFNGKVTLAAGDVRTDGVGRSEPAHDVPRGHRDERAAHRAAAARGDASTHDAVPAERRAAYRRATR